MSLLATPTRPTLAVRLRRALLALGLGAVASVVTAVPSWATTITPSSLSFDARAVGTESTAKPVFVYESYNPAGGVQPRASATTTGDFRAVVSCQRTSCLVNVWFRPTETGPRTGTLTIVDNFDVAHDVGLSGMGEEVITASFATPLGTVSVVLAGLGAFTGVQLLSRRRAIGASGPTSPA
jgi:hypothetical protein